MSFKVDWQVFKHQRMLLKGGRPDNYLRYAFLKDGYELSITDFDGKTIYTFLSDEQAIKDFMSLEGTYIEFLRYRGYEGIPKYGVSTSSSTEVTAEDLDENIENDTSDGIMVYGLNPW